MGTASTKSRQPWPIWLLVLAWICANCPGHVIYSGLTWLDHARTFSHHNRLKLEVASLLTRTEIPALPEHVAPAIPTDRKPPAPTVESARRVELAFEPELRVAPAAMRVFRWRPEPQAPLVSVAFPPPHDPPRSARS